MKLIDKGMRFAKEMTVLDFAMLKFCMFSIGVIVALLLPESVKQIVLGIAIFVFVITYFPLMVKFFKTK
ncbi:MAG: permease of phosphate ABC transporter [Clostridia bacterium]|nr:permease of phosphate ABC transporter [Clostridia bacterium]